MASPAGERGKGKNEEALKRSRGGEVHSENCAGSECVCVLVQVSGLDDES